MIQSMTGFGAAACDVGGVAYRVEIRCVNNRYFKASIKLPDVFQRFESEIEKLLRDGLYRGSVAFALRVKDPSAAGAYEINTAALAAYAKRLSDITATLPGTRVDLSGLLEVPGVCDAGEMDEKELLARFAVVQKLTAEAIQNVEKMRRAEGEALQRDLTEQCGDIRKRLLTIGERCPSVVAEYHKRLTGRVQQLLSGGTVQLDEGVLAREVAVFAERCDVNEELSRLTCHLDQFAELCGGRDDAGRKLDFLAQEMLREANTIGSKANDAPIARQIVEIKSAIDRIKEQVQNVA
ncbi:MAG: YicC family protein [Planctomycetes bacterium]|nr:YicC family protein [Planctomycetota bacterium]